MTGGRKIVVCIACLLTLVIAAPSGCTGSDPTAPGAVAGVADPTAPDGGAPAVLIVTSTSFADGGSIPARYCALGVDGASNVSPHIAWSAAPEGTRSLLVAIVDHHPVARMWVHWVVVDLPPTVTELAEAASGGIPSPARELKNTSGRAGYGGPKPPVGSGDHDYVVTVYALDIDDPSLPTEPDAADITRAVAGHTLAMGTITGVFGR